MIFKHKSNRDALLEKVLRLSRDEAKYWRKISVVPDLTIKQRELERNVFKKAHDRKLNRTGDEQAKNLCDKVIGKRKGESFEGPGAETEGNHKPGLERNS